MWTRAFWVDTFERAVKTFAQAAFAGIGANATGLLDVEWLTILSVAGLAALLSVLSSIASAASSIGNSGNASLISTNDYS